MHKTEISHVILLPDMLSFLLFLFSEESQFASTITSFVFPWKTESGATFIDHCLISVNGERSNGSNEHISCAENFTKGKSKLFLYHTRGTSNNFHLQTIEKALTQLKNGQSRNT